MTRGHFAKLERMHTAAPVIRSFRPVSEVGDEPAVLSMPGLGANGERSELLRWR